MILATWVTKKRAVVVLVIVLVVAVGLWLFFTVRDNDEGSANPTQNALDTANLMTDEGNYDQALQTLKDAEKSATTEGEKIRILNDLAAAAANAGKLEEALAYYQQKHQLDPGSSKSDGNLVGELYERLGQIQQALESYQVYLAYLKSLPSDEFSEARIASMTARIQAMEESQ